MRSVKKGSFIAKRTGTVLTGLNNEGVPDAENPEASESFFKNAKKGLEGLAELIGEEAAAPLRKRGRPKVDSPKRVQSFKLSTDVIESIKASGRGYNGRVEAVLRDAIKQGLI